MRRLCGILVAVTAVLWPLRARADLPERPAVSGTDVTEVDVWTGARDGSEASLRVAWASLAETNVTPGPRSLAFPVPAGADAVLVPVCAGRKRVLVDDAEATVASGPVVLDMPGDGRAHRVTIRLDVSSSEHRVACGEPPRVGTRATARDGLLSLTFTSAHAASGGGQACGVRPTRSRHAPAGAPAGGAPPLERDPVDLCGL